MVSARRFRKAFIDQWNHEIANNLEALLEHHPGTSSWKTPWTTYMLKGENAFLKKVANRLKLTMRPEVRTLDAIYYKAGNEVLPEKNRPYPARLEVCIEHENGRDPEKEMYKLLIWPATLKVLILYDTSRRAQRVDRKLTQFFEMAQEIDRQRPGASEAAYLFLIGRGEEYGQPLTWRYLCARDGDWPEQPRKPRVLRAGKCSRTSCAHPLHAKPPRCRAASHGSEGRTI